MTNISPQRRPEQIAFANNGHLPDIYRQDLLAEARRIETEILRPRGLPGRRVPDGVRELIGGMNSHLFDGVEANRGFHGNYEITYPVA